MCITLFVHFLPSLYIYDVKWSKFELTRDWERQGDKFYEFYYLVLNSDAVACLQLQPNFRTFKSLGDLLWGRKSLNECKINFLVTFSLAWTLSDRKVPIIWGTLSEILHAEILVLPTPRVPGFAYALWLACFKCHCRFANQDEGTFETLFR